MAAVGFGDQAPDVMRARPARRSLHKDWQSAGFGVYIHWPFCLAKCPYCDFNSHVSRSVDQAAWADALLREAGHMRNLTGPRRVDTVFFGGGTPSLMAPRTVDRIVTAINQLWGLAPDAEITLEANPTSAEAAKFQAYARAGVNRLSMGIQALDDADLKALGRTHTAAEARAAFEIARGVFQRISFDLIYARTRQTTAAWERELADAMAMAVDHLSLYQLTLESGTRFADLHARGKLTVPPDDLAAEMYAVTQAMTDAAGLPAYEISNHARPGAESRHNLIYWRYGDFAGIGPGAHGRLTTHEGRIATITRRDPAAWLADVAARGHAVIEAPPISPNDQAEEYLLMALRLVAGADLARYEALAGTPLPGRRVDDLVADGLLRRNGSRLAATAAGRLVLNRVLADLL